MTVRARALVASVAVALVALSLAAAPALAKDSPVVAAMRASLDAKSMRWSMDSTTRVGGDSVRMRGTALQKGLTVSMEMTVEAQGQTFPMEARMLREAGHLVMYMASPAFAEALPKGKTWMRIDLDEAGKATGLDVSGVIEVGRTLEPLLAGLVSSERVGSDVVRGRPMARYHVVVDAQKAGRAVPAYGAQLEALRRASGIRLARLDYDVWIDAGGRFRQMRFTMPTVAGKTRGEVEMTMTIEAYGVPVDVVAPPRRLVADA